MSEIVKKRKKVLFVSHTANFSKFNRPFMQWFRKQNVEVHYASAGEEPVLDCDKNFVVPFERSPFAFTNIKAYKELKQIIKREKYDMIHCHTPVGSVVTRLAARKYKKKYGTKILYTAHGFHFYHGAPIINWLLYYPMEKFVSCFTDCLITINEEDYRLAATKLHCCDVRKIDGVGVDLRRYHPVSTEAKMKIRTEFGYSKDDFVLIYVAEFTNNKNHIFVVEAAKEIKKQCPSTKIIFVGTGSRFDEIKKVVKDLQLDDTIFFLGYRSDVDKLYQISDVYISASKREGLPVSVIESMASGLPVICTKIRGQIDLICEGRNGFLYNIGDLNKFKNSINILYKNDEIIKKICRNNTADVEKYSLDNALKNMFEIYDDYI